MGFRPVSSFSERAGPRPVLLIVELKLRHDNLNYHIAVEVHFQVIEPGRRAPPAVRPQARRAPRVGATTAHKTAAGAGD